MTFSQTFLLCLFVGASTALKVLGFEPVPDENGLYRMGDMILDENQMKLFVGTEEEKEMAARQAVEKKWNRWSNNVMPYKIDSSVGWHNVEIRKIKSAIKELNDALANCFEIRYSTITY